MATLIKHKRVEFSELFYDLCLFLQFQKQLLNSPYSCNSWCFGLEFLYLISFISVMVIINSYIQTIIPIAMEQTRYLTW